MTEHEHEWRVTPSGRCQIICASSMNNEIHAMAWDEVSRRLNATEKLSAEDAIELALSARAAGSITDQQLADKADTYAAALEWK